MHTALMAICIDNNYFEVDGYLYYTDKICRFLHYKISLRFCNTSRYLRKNCIIKYKLLALNFDAFSISSSLHTYETSISNEPWLKSDG